MALSDMVGALGWFSEAQTHPEGYARLLFRNGKNALAFFILRHIFTTIHLMS